MTRNLESQVQKAAMKDTVDTFTQPLDLRVLEVRALCRIADTLERIATQLEEGGRG